MNIFFYVIGFSFSFFFILLSYWKEDKNLNILGSLVMIILSIILTGTSIQSTDYSLDYIQTISNATGNYSIYNSGSHVYNNGVFYENIGIGLMLVLFSSLQYLYFSIAYKFAERREN